MSQSNPYYQRFPRDEFADTGHLTCEEYGLLQRLRDWSWHHEGIPDARDSFKRLARMFQLSRYKFEKLWKGIENFFTLFEGFWTYEIDERKRLHVVDIASKRRKSGQLGAESRWSTRNETADSGMANGMANAMAKDPAPSMANQAHHHQNPNPDIREEPPPPPTPIGADLETGGGGGSPPLFESNQQHADLQTIHNALNCRAETLGMPHPGKSLAKKIRSKFPRGWSPQQIADSLVRFPGQNSPGLWGKLELEQLIAEARRQASTESPSTTSSGRGKMSIEEKIRLSRYPAGTAPSPTGNQTTEEKIKASR